MLALLDFLPPILSGLPTGWEPGEFYCVNCRAEVPRANVVWSPGVEQFRHRVLDMDCQSPHELECGPCEAIAPNPLTDFRGVS